MHSVKIIIAGISALRLLLFIALPYQAVTAFSHPSVLHSRKKNFYPRPTKPFFSSIGDDKESTKSKGTLKLPDPPEDLLTLSGDVLSIFLYTYIDHESTWLFDTLSVSSSNHPLISLSEEMSSSRVPVWFNPHSVEPFGSIPLSSALPIEHLFLYTPALIYPGLASVLFVIIWIFTSMLTGALSFKNTHCDSQRALLITAYTWTFTALQMALVAWASDVIIGYIDAFHRSIGVTRGDMGYICGSLTVLLFWRFIVSTLLGSGNDGPQK